MKVKKHLRPDHQMFDEVKIVTVPRYKESEISGDEWRISSCLQFLCKGIVMHERCFSDIKTAIDFIGAEYWVGAEQGRERINEENAYCDQEGCVKKPTVFYKLKKQFNSDGDIKKYQFDQHRSFCERHKRRGDCGLEDADTNYEEIV